MYLIIKRNIKCCMFLKDKRFEEINRNIYSHFVKPQIQFSSINNNINSSTQLIVKCINETYKSKNFNKIKWKCLSNDIIQNINKFSVKEILNIINILSRLYLGKNILINIKPLIIEKLDNINSNGISKIIIAYLKANISDHTFYNKLCLKLQKDIKDISISSLISLVYNINFYSNIKNVHIYNIEKEILNHIISYLEINHAFDHIEKLTYEYNSDFVKLKSKKNEQIYDDTYAYIENESIPIKNECTVMDSQYMCTNIGNAMNEQEGNKIEKKNEEQNIWLMDIKNYNFILLLYSTSNYLFSIHLEDEKILTMNKNFSNYLKMCYHALNSLINKNEFKKFIKEELKPFYLFLLYKAMVNTIYIYEDKYMNEILFNHIKNKINNFILYLKKNISNLKGKTNEIVKYINILQQNLNKYSKNKKAFQDYFDNNVILIKSLLLLLQQNNQNDIKKYYPWHREQIEMIQQTLRSIERAQ
ncbi:conserved Plasmodium protein, unknown function [Plasmodium berghei]|uniref:Uncharacterized protein n=2 Tax=Plasmodium berghei TaxID=5821 RepID=A0A509ARU9_PLABA|nr:conserved Plasmodium protein, unknown function [Plasmodium berghei ANKA]CXJ21974.1 conserved Plasmodium protein, unknown function [Plasmodium berghei]SCM26633.1 conserved Plasmodium protein, unknown function [Plasmodium berghei]SCN28557.1 conserved Plasmodium protein, unknown function [Plasmodium berghei]SCO62746.1 conserved Plasmodium protein, unknown function [Plasmodium berghei]SCO64306.1 conserved Plasmodium protein, unknown function [Plasmodium berghei]|eukprot:XP_034424202.1 conserved Plasmodium protein, unknown function [Plasmodium berghei ANKA]